MRWLACLLVLGGIARADDAGDLVVKGEALAKESEWSQAITAFKAADAIRSSAKHACLIGLAYTRREAWAEAELFFGICRNRATAADPLPTWFSSATAELEAKLSEAGAVAITLEVDPPTAEISMTGFAPDERVHAQTIHLTPGTYVAQASAKGYLSLRRDIVVVAGQPQIVKLALSRRERPSRVPLYLMIGGGALVAGGIAYDVLALRPARDALGPSNAAYEENLDDFRTKRAITVGLLASGAAVALAGIALRYTVYKRENVQVAATATGERTMVVLQWQR